jgi:glucose-1-phosphate cytidylyltransferase
MKAVILAGGFGTRISEETDIRPKPMVEIGDKPILWHIMKAYSHYGVNDFVILLGYKSYMIKEYFANYFLHNSDVTIDTSRNSMEIHNNASENWRITLVDTGLGTMTGGRIKRAQKYIGSETFFLTYGDGVSDVNISKLLETHRAHGKAMTVTAIQPDGRFGAIEFSSGDQISSFREKPQGDGAWINGGFFVCEPALFDYLKEGDETVLERAPLEGLAKDGQLVAYRHNGFWRCMDTLRDKQLLCQLWETGDAPWKVWSK